MKVLYLYSEIMDYQIPILKEYVKSYGAEVHVIYWDKNKNTPYRIPDEEKITFHTRSSFDRQGLIEFVSGLKPDIVYISGWMDKGYLAAAKALRKCETPVITGFDDIWYYTLRQTVASWIFPLMIKKKFFSHAWVAGPYQYHYAKRLGFKDNEIIFNLLSANCELFEDKTKFQKEIFSDRKKTFLFVGRYHEVKGLLLLIDVFDSLSEKNKDWNLKLIGNGPLESELNERAAVNPNIIVRDFMQPDELAAEIRGSDVFILPSNHEPWGVVIHEFCAAGMPMILSDCCGAAPVFLIHGYNGFLFKDKSFDSLREQMSKMMAMKPEDILEMGKRSYKLSKRITPEISAASFMSVLK